MTHGRDQRSVPFHRALHAGLLLVIVIASVWAWQRWDSVAALLADVEAARTWFRSLGPWGPLAFILLNAAQIVVAPIPGYPVQAAAGYIFGVYLGGLWATLGLALGSFIAASLVRQFGRPLVIALFGEPSLRHWEHMVRADSVWLWFVAFLGPTGDIPYFIAGLSSVPVWKLVLVAVLVRGPAVMVAAAVGAGLMTLTSSGVVTILVVAGGVAFILYRLGPRLKRLV